MTEQLSLFTGGGFSTLVGIAGQKQSGKNTVAKLIAAHLPGETVEIAYATKMKESLAAFLGIPVEWIDLLKEGTSRIKIHPDPDLSLELIEGLFSVELTFREAIQRYGTEAHRDVFRDSFWIEEALRDRDKSKITIVTDVRFPNEMEAIRDRGGMMIKVVRPGLPEDEHPSEQGIPDDDCQVVILNDGTLDELAIGVEGLLRSMLEYAYTL